jgi:hypothetical protein
MHQQAGRLAHGCQIIVKVKDVEHVVLIVTR